MEMDCILLIEDSEDDVLMMKYALEEAAIANPVQAVTSAEEGIEYLEGTGKYADRTLYPKPAVVFVDLKLPGKPGHEVLQWMAGKVELKHVLRAVLTGSNDPEDRTIAQKLGAHCYFEKPITSEQLTGPKRNLLLLAGGVKGGGPLQPGVSAAPGRWPVPLVQSTRSAASG